ncbi:MAG: tetratricopeptide repeat protein [Myxococcales bacterium]|nr:tetratricopeptide repeat protein [Myxococcales bacterium]
MSPVLGLALVVWGGATALAAAPLDPPQPRPTAVHGQPQAPPSPPQAPQQQRAISAQMGQVLAEILQAADPLADGSTINGAAIERDHAVITIQTLTGELAVFVLRAPTAAGGSDGLRQFTLDGPLGSVRASLAARLAGGEQRFGWTSVQVALPQPASPTAIEQLHAIARQVGEIDPEQLAAQTDRLLPHFNLDSADAQTAWTVARLLWSQTRLPLARPWLQRVVVATQALDPRQAPAGTLGARLGALELLNQGAQADRDFATCLSVGRAIATCGSRDRSEAAGLRGDWAAAALHYDRILGDGQTATLADLIERAALAMRLADSNSELVWAERALQRFAGHADALYLWATACFRAGRFEEAVRGFEKLYHLDPSRVSVLAHLSGAFNRMHGSAATAHARQAYDKLRAEFEQRARDPRDAVAVFLVAVAVFYDADFAKAIEAFTPLQALLPAEPRVPIYLAMAHYWTGDLAAARRFAAIAVSKGPRDPDVYYCRSKVWQDERPAQAIADLQRYITMAEAPGAIAFADKTARIREEMDYLRRGERPPDWDRPAFGEDIPVPLVAAAVMALALLVWLGWRWRQRRRR